ncbi:hypothetical protein HZA45_02040 [Candidatus Peregrinibacteria bacterium]|nr:hypothetical protein [Candidatus Peregrinibacteria bacterium]
MKKILSDYPRLLSYSCAIILAYFFYQTGYLQWIGDHLDGFGYPSIFLAGALYGFGFTAPFASAYFIAISPHVSPLPAAIIGGIGAATADMTIFQLITVSFRNELVRLHTTNVYKRIHALLCRSTASERLRCIGKWLLAGITIASPLPDEIGVTILATVTDIESKRMAVLCFTLNAMGIFVLLQIVR